MQVRTGAVAAGAYITDNLTFFHILACTNNQAAHMSISSFQAKIMADANIATIAAVPAGLLHIAGGCCINWGTIIIGDIKAGMPGIIIATKGIGATTKVRGDFAASCGPLARSNITAIVFAFDST